MQIPTLFVILFAFFTAAFAAPVERRAAVAVFKTQTYNQLSISGGKAGTAQALASAKFAALNLANAKNVAASDLDFLNSVNQIANDAETEAFNPAIAAATGAAKTALQNGKIQNKVLKLTASVLKLQVQAAQGQNTASQLATEQKKLATNIALDKKAAGQAATKLSFNAST
ncbi:hypothetical protein HYPSUDRAFT_55836 [Hypholoma sublateritium FD-334 SS-4]|uniref:Small secreted protein n=1 Tax=Hypholoma sublateritium (strain FD-334 SS-4) TaxID=945553 RepID=A0A0D2NWJ5_HYPSF|nr:hypothetical protein HYPSUDRAFT_55836 [Hypholoma sublateritium FD-334 SS-4]